MKKMGRTHAPFFRICAMDKRSPRDGRVIEELGTYDPMVSETDARAILKGDRINYWLGVGAKPTQKVGTLIKKYGAEGTHLDAQNEAIARLGDRRATAIESARAAAASVKMPEAPKPAEETPAVTEGAEAKPEGAETKPEGEEVKAETTDAAAEAPAAEAKKEEPAAEEKAAE
jgi:small subunit ribosomal protein S16